MLGVNPMDKEIITSLKENIKYIYYEPAELSVGFNSSKWVLYCLETDDAIHYFFSMKQTRQDAKPCDKPDGFKVQIDKEKGIPYLIKKKKWF